MMKISEIYLGEEARILTIFGYLKLCCSKQELILSFPITSVS
jgi:hypothetical protein